MPFSQLKKEQLYYILLIYTQSFHRLEKTWFTIVYPLLFWNYSGTDISTRLPHMSFNNRTSSFRVIRRISKIHSHVLPPYFLYYSITPLKSLIISSTTTPSLQHSPSVALNFIENMPAVPYHIFGRVKCQFFLHTENWNRIVTLHVLNHWNLCSLMVSTAVGQQNIFS